MAAMSIPVRKPHRLRRLPAERGYLGEDARYPFRWRIGLICGKRRGTCEGGSLACSGQEDLWRGLRWRAILSGYKGSVTGA